MENLKKNGKYTLDENTKYRNEYKKDENTKPLGHVKLTWEVADQVEAAPWEQCNLALRYRS